MARDNHVRFLDIGRKDELAKVQHTGQSIRANRLIASMQTHIHLAIEYFLKVQDRRSFFNPRSLHRRVWRCYG